MSGQWIHSGHLCIINFSFRFLFKVICDSYISVHHSLVCTLCACNTAVQDLLSNGYPSVYRSSSQTWIPYSTFSSFLNPAAQKMSWLLASSSAGLNLVWLTLPLVVDVSFQRSWMLHEYGSSPTTENKRQVHNLTLSTCLFIYSLEPDFL